MSSDFETFTGIQPAAPFVVKTGGSYQFTVQGTFNAGSATFQQLAPDGVSWLNVDTAFTANGGGVYLLPPGRYQWVNSAITGYNVSLIRIPGG